MFEFIGPISSGVVVFGVAFLAGYLSRGQATATSVDIPRGEANNCQSLCDAWQALRRFRCNSARAEADAWVAIRALNASIASASTYAAVLLASAIAASLIPFIGAGIAAGLFAAYAAATTYVAFLLGQQAAAVQSAVAHICRRSLPGRERPCFCCWEPCFAEPGSWPAGDASGSRLRSGKGFRPCCRGEGK